MKSIIQEDLSVCYLCGGRDGLEEHHIFSGNPGRKHSEQYGLKVKLCGHSCHKFGKYAVHQNAEINRFLRQEAQRKCMAYHNMPVEEFIRLFGKNYI